MPLLPPIPVSTSSNITAARSRVLRLYKDWLRASTDIISFHYLDTTNPVVRHRIRQEFEKNRNVSDVRVIDTLLFKGRIELEETLNKWKNKTHVMRYFNDDVKFVPKEKTFLDRFYEGSA